MKKIILSLFISFFTIAMYSQDTIIVKKPDNTNAVILCKITKVTSMNIFYTENKVGQFIALKEVVRYYQSSQKESSSSAEQNKTIPSVANTTSDEGTIIRVKKTFTVLFISFRGGKSRLKKELGMYNDMRAKGYEIKQVYTLPKVGIPIFCCEKTVHVFQRP